MSKELAKTYDPKQIEEKLYERWCENKYFHAEVDRSKKPFTTVMPPPNITGKLHMGHALDNTLQDILIRYKRMEGYNALWIPGTDHAAISTEVKVTNQLKEEGIDKKRPLGVPTFNDKLIQEVVRMVLEAIYEGNFEYTSHGFRPNRSCHTALTHIQKEFNGAKWFVEGDIKGFFDNINHDVLINILLERIADERFIRLIRKFMKAGYIEDWQFHNTYSGTPQGGIISPIL